MNSSVLFVVAYFFLFLAGDGDLDLFFANFRNGPNEIDFNATR